MTTTASRIGQISLVIIPSTDQDRAIALYESLGFEKRTDVAFGGQYRWVEVYPPGGTTGIALAPPRPEDPTSMETGITLTTDDIDATHAELRSLEVDAERGRSVTTGHTGRTPSAHGRCPGSGTVPDPVPDTTPIPMVEPILAGRIGHAFDNGPSGNSGSAVIGARHGARPGAGHRCRSFGASTPRAAGGRR